VKIIEEWKKAHKSFSVLLPFIATTVALLISILTSVLESGVVSVDNEIYWGYALTVLTYLGRIIKQVGLFNAITGSEVESNKEE